MTDPPARPHKVPLALRRLFILIFGRWRWDRPAWAAAIAIAIAGGWRFFRASTTRSIALLLALAAAGGGLYWYLTRPTPHYVTLLVNDPAVTAYNDNGTLTITPLTVTFSESAAALKLIDKTITTGIDVSPAVPGTWRWTTDRELRFAPRDDWPVDGNFTVRLSPNVLARQARLERNTFTFRSQPFSARFTDSQFYQDPRDPNLKKLVATVTFSHPVDPEAFERHVSLLTAKDAEYLGLSPDSRHFTVLYDKFKLAAHIHSSALAMPRDDTPMTVRVDSGVRAARGGNETRGAFQTVVTIPGRTSLRFSGAVMTVVDNARYEPEQIVFVTSSSPVTERALQGKVSVMVLPERSPRQDKDDLEPWDWRGDEEEIGAEILAKSSAVPVTAVQTDEGSDTTHGFKVNAPVGRFLYVLVKDGVEGTGGYIAGKPYVATVKVRPYPTALTFLGKGALLQAAGDHKVGFLVRDVDQVQVDVARVLPNQLQHLAEAMWNFERPNVYGDLENRLVERFGTVRDYRGGRPGKPTYDSIDLGQYLHDQAGSRRGLFLLHVRAVAKPRPAESEDDEAPRYRRDRIEDTRLILVTDLGFVVKLAKDGSRDVFVQSIRTGLPVAGARVDLNGANGLPVVAATTDTSGRARIAAPPTDAIREKQPRLILVQTNDDMSFMPLSSGSRALDVSRFDTGGVQSAKSAQQVSTYLFSDRGIYRPGETTHLGLITRTADWQSSLAGLPVDVEIADPRGVVVSRSQVKLSSTAFDELAFTSGASAQTGTYEAVAWLAKDDRHREPLGSTTFKVQEFEPDLMKMQLELATVPVAGWLRPQDVKAEVTVTHLFGDAAANRRVEGELSLSPVLPRFSKYDDYRFSIGEVIKEPYHEALAALTTDDNGHAAFALDLPRFVGRAYRLNVLARAFESAGGRSVAAENNAIVSDADFLVGVKPDGSLSYVRRTSVRGVRWLAVNRNLAPVAANALTLEWVQRKFVSVLTQQNNGTYAYVSRLKEIVRNSRAVSISVGGTTFPLPTDEPGDFALVLRDVSGAKLNTVDYTVAGNANLSRSLDRNAELQVQLDKAAYGGGDTIEVSIRAPYVGAGLITVERERVFAAQWFKTTATSSVQHITLPADFEGNGYVSVQFVRDPASDELFMSPLSFGVAPFTANLSARTLSPTLTAAKQIKPGAPLTIHLTSTEPSQAVVLAVDEGILQVARYRNPDPLGYFFQKRMLEVQTSQILDLILPDFKRFIALAAPGGDADGGFARHLNPFNKKRKAAVAYWSGVVPVGPSGRDLTYTAPDYFNGKLRIVAIVASAGRVGVAEAGTEVKGDFILTPNVPVTVTPGDEFVVSVGVFNNTTGGSGPIRISAELGAGLSLVSAPTADLQVPDLKEGVAEFRIKANPSLGPAAMTFTARRGVASARAEESVGVRPPAVFRTQLTLGRVDSTNATATLTRDLYTEQRKVEAAVSTIPLVWGSGLSVYLDHYEYTCTEQLASKGMAALIFLSRPELGTVHASDAKTLDATYAALRSRLNDSGGLGLWASTPETADFATIHAAQFLVEANERGQKIPQDLLTTIDQWMTRFATTPASTLDDARWRAYAVYLLTRQGLRVNAALSNVEQELTKRYPQQWSTDIAAAYLASTYRLMQRNDDADRLIKGVPWSVQKKELSAGGRSVYYNAVDHDAVLLYLLARHFPSRLGSTPPASIEAIGNPSTLDAILDLMALDAFAKASPVTATLGVTAIGANAAERALKLSAGAIRKADVDAGTAKVQFTKAGSGTAYYAITEAGFDKDLPAAEISKGLEVFREFLDAKGNPVSRATVGEEFLVRVRVRATSRDVAPMVALVDLLPGGVEPVIELRPQADTSTPGVDPAMLRQRGAVGALPIGVVEKSDWEPYHVDVREDRLILYGDVFKDAKTFVYRVRATNAGTYRVPPAFAEGMYDRAVVAIGRGATLEIVKP